MLQPLTEDELNGIYNWVDQIPLTRPKKNIARDFSDGVLLAEIVNYFLPKYIDIHNYSQANSVKQKKYNWETLNTKVFKKMGFQLSREQVDSVIQCQPEAIERVLKFVQQKLEIFMEQSQARYSGDKKNSEETVGLPQPPVSNDWQKEQTIYELRETIEILEQKLYKMDEMMKAKDVKIAKYQQIMQQHGLL
ncbi:Sperm flagellar protein 1 [Paramecium bursaria]